MNKTLEKIILYSNRVLKDEILSCKKHKWACERFLNDLETANFDYIFDIESAEKFFDWMRLFKHRKGILSGQYIEPVDIQLFIFGNIYGWKNKDTNRRRFSKAYWQVARKNAKSQSLSMVGSYEMSGFGVYASEVYSVATKKEQAKIVWEETSKMLMNSQLKNKFRVAYSTIFHDKSDSIFKTLTQEDKTSGDGLNPQCGLVDEYHAHKTDEYVEILESGMMARAEPLIFIITTAGFELNNPCYTDEYKYVSDLLNPSIEVKNESYFAMVNELEKDENGNIIDDVFDPKVYIKANPILVTYKEGIDNLINRARIAKDIPTKWRKFLTKNMNIWVNMSEGKYMSDEKFALCVVKEDLKTISNKEIFVGVDLSATLDLTSVSLIWFEGAELQYISMSFMPEEALETKIRMDNVPYDQWVRDGFLILTPGAEVDYFVVKDWILNFCKEHIFEIREICFDKWNALMFAQCMKNEGITCVEIGQNYSGLSEATKKFKALIYNKKAKIFYNPCLNFAVSNAIVRTDHAGNIMLDKEKSTKRIDPLASGINAINRALFHFNLENELEVVII